MRLPGRFLAVAICAVAISACDNTTSGGSGGGGSSVDGGSSSGGGSGGRSAADGGAGSGGGAGGGGTDGGTGSGGGGGSSADCGGLAPGTLGSMIRYSGSYDSQGGHCASTVGDGNGTLAVDFGDTFHLVNPAGAQAGFANFTAASEDGSHTAGETLHEGGDEIRAGADRHPRSHQDLHRPLLARRPALTGPGGILGRAPGRAKSTTLTSPSGKSTPLTGAGQRR